MRRLPYWGDLTTVLSKAQVEALEALRGALDAPVVERQEEAYTFEDYVYIEAEAREVMRVFGYETPKPTGQAPPTWATHGDAMGGSR